jgi:hypothetical protein
MSDSPKKVMLALTGRDFSSQFVACLIHTLFTVWQSSKYDIVLSFGPQHDRLKTMGLSPSDAENIPFGGREYDVFATIDSDIIFNANQLIEIIDGTEKYPVVAGLYRAANGKSFECVKSTATSPLTPADIIDPENRYVDVEHSGLGFFAVRKEVIDAMKYPYFFWTGSKCSEDVAFCKNVREAGYAIVADTQVIVGHEKTFVI